MPTFREDAALAATAPAGEGYVTEEGEDLEDGAGIIEAVDAIADAMVDAAAGDEGVEFGVLLESTKPLPSMGGMFVSDAGGADMKPRITLRTASRFS